ncbi:hypothetical protein C8Q70DRAFT_698378 [Cubamyces menziesii]|nr:hypothetical protein C8Q70DRAFT_698378 [Cubamyces menziesii]
MRYSTWPSTTPRSPARNRRARPLYPYLSSHRCQRATPRALERRCPETAYSAPGPTSMPDFAQLDVSPNVCTGSADSHLVYNITTLHLVPTSLAVRSSSCSCSWLLPLRVVPHHAVVSPHSCTNTAPSSPPSPCCHDLRPQKHASSRPLEHTHRVSTCAARRLGARSHHHAHPDPPPDPSHPSTSRLSGIHHHIASLVCAGYYSLSAASVLSLSLSQDSPRVQLCLCRIGRIPYHLSAFYCYFFPLHLFCFRSFPLSCSCSIALLHFASTFAPRRTRVRATHP